MFTHSCKSIWIVIFLVVVLLIGACQPTPPVTTEPPPATTEAPTEPPPATTEAPTAPPTEPPVTPPATQKSFVEPPPIMVHEYGKGGEPSLCNPAQAVLTPTGQLPVQVAPSRIVEGATAQSVDYVNPQGQTFRITVHSVDPSAAKQYLATLAVCLEAIEVGPPSGIEAATPPFEQFLRDEISKAAGISLEELEAMWEKYIADTVASSGTPSLRGFLESIGLSSDEILKNVMERANLAVDDALNAKLLTDEQANDLRVRVQNQYNQEYTGSTFSLSPKVPGDLGDELKANPVNLVIEAEWLDRSDQQNFMIFSAWEPTVVSAGAHWYSWKNSTYVDACLYLYQGGTGDYIYRWTGTYTYLTGASKYAPGWTYWISASSSTAMWYRLEVYGYYATNTYDLYGSWRGTNPG